MQKIITDTVCDNIAKLLTERINTISKDNYKTYFVKTYRSWNDDNIALTEYPVLKVFRVKDNFNNQSYKIISNIVVQYSFVMNKDYSYIPFLNQVGKLINSLMVMLEEESVIIMSNNVPITGEIQVTQGKDDIYGLYTYSCGLCDSSLPDNLIAYLLPQQP